MPLALMTLLHGGCRVEKPPPRVQWLSPDEGIAITGGDAISLRFEVEDPPATKANVDIGQWRIEIGPTAGGTWWTTAGELSAAPSGDAVLDTVEATWHIPGGTPFSGISTDLLLKAVATDGEGQAGADFLYASWEIESLESAGLWWAGNPDGDGFSHVESPASPSIVHHALPVSQEEWLVHLDGEDKMIIGGGTLRGWELDAETSAPGPEPAWTAELPTSATQSGIRYLRRVPHTLTVSAWVESGWGDRCLWHDGDGILQKSWLLETNETLLDGGVIGNHMVLLARTSSGEFRLIRFNIDTGTRLGSVTWTPEAAGSIGPGGKGWLLALNGMPTALEADGTARQWNPEGAANAISTLDMPGTGDVTFAACLEDGRSWLSRSQSIMLDASGSAIATWNATTFGITSDRATDLLCILVGSDGERAWQWAHGTDLSPIGSAFPTGGATPNGSIAHNRPGGP